MNKMIFRILVILQFISLSIFGQNIQKDLIYKKIDTTSLHLKIYYPDNYTPGKKYPAIILFFGGGWNSGKMKQFEPHAKYFASKGMIGITADYRVKSRQNTSPFDAVEDAKSAIRYLRENATQLGINANLLAAGGGSAGGHLAAAADLIPSVKETFSSRPNALVLFNPVFNNGPGNYGYDRIGERYPEISPYHNIKKGGAPTIAFFGTKDAFVPVPTIKEYELAMKNAGNRFELHLYEGQVHGFFNYKEKGDNTYYLDTIEKATNFLISLGFIDAK
jgi:acetyl esterase